MTKKQEIEKLASDHWEYIEGLLGFFPAGPEFNIAIAEYLYKTAFVHGYKHAMACYLAEDDD